MNPMEELQQAVWDLIQEMDDKHSAASTYLIQAYHDIHKYKLDDRIVSAILTALVDISESNDEEIAEDIAIKIHRLIRTVAA